MIKKTILHSGFLSAVLFTVLLLTVSSLVSARENPPKPAVKYAEKQITGKVTDGNTGNTLEGASAVILRVNIFNPFFLALQPISKASPISPLWLLIYRGIVFIF